MVGCLVPVPAQVEPLESDVVGVSSFVGRVSGCSRERVLHVVLLAEGDAFEALSGTFLTGLIANVGIKMN
jgi:hypothetical protein